MKWKIMKLDIAGETNRGLSRTRNEDSFVYCNWDGMPSSLVVVADGIGGHRDGDIASFVCCREMLVAWRREAAGIDSIERAADFLTRTVCAINTMLNDTNRRIRKGQPMGTTIVAAVILPESVVVLHAGDSRFYRFDAAGVLESVTNDHTLLAKLENSGRRAIMPPSPELANIIARAVGPRAKMEPELQVIASRPGDRYMLCSDGVSRFVDDAEIGRELGAVGCARDAVNHLMRAALIAGGLDNITAVCAFVPKKED